MNKNIKTGILSFGMSGQLFHSPFIFHHPCFELSAIVERTNKKAQLTYPEINSYDSIDELLTDDTIELVVVNTPNPTHYEFAVKAIRAKKHVLVEKPFTITSEQATELFKEGKNMGCRILPYQNRRYDSDFLSVKKVLEAGYLGKVVEAHLRYDRYQYDIGHSIYKETKLPGSGLLYNLGPHLLDAAIALFGLPLNWTKTLEYHRPNTLVDDYAQIHLVYPKGLQVFITTSLLVVEPEPAFVINGTKGSYMKHRSDIQEQQLKDGLSPMNPLFGVEDDVQKGILTTIESDGTKTQIKVAAVKSSYFNVLDDVYETIVNGQPYPVTEQQILKQLEILES